MAQNKDNADSLQAAIRNIVPHAFGKHEKSDELWCQFKNDPKDTKGWYHRLKNAQYKKMFVSTTQLNINLLYSIHRQLPYVKMRKFVK